MSVKPNTNQAKPMSNEELLKVAPSIFSSYFQYLCT